MNAEELQYLRFMFQKILVPIVVIVGCLGNGISCVVLTRRRMRCSTNIYLTALALADILFLLFVLILSFQHYSTMHGQKYEFYWRVYGLSVWILDAAGYTSIYLTVSFTIERYIAVCHPIRGQVLCTESRAKKVIAVVFLFCFISTITTSFEHQIGYETRYYNKTSNELCKNYSPPPFENTPSSGEEINSTNNSTMMMMMKMIESNENVNFNFKENENKSIEFQNRNNKNNILRPTDAGNDVEVYDDGEYDRRKRTSVVYYNRLRNIKMRSFNDSMNEKIQKIPVENKNDDILKLDEITNKDECEARLYFDTKPSDFGNNVTYQKFINIFSSVVFTFTPLILLATFNCYLIAAVHRSSRLRHAMTNNSSNRPNDSSSIQQENKITIILIAVCVLFFVCQSPTAIFLILKSIIEIKDTNEVLALGNFFNFLISLNAACNFILYCVLSDKYRQTVRHLFCSKKGQYSQNSYRSSQISRFTSTGQSSIRFNNNASQSNNTVSKILLNRQKSLPVKSTIDRKDASIKLKPTASIYGRFLTPDIPTKLLIDNNNCRPRRTNSLDLGKPTRHSPDCRSNPQKF